MNSIVDRLVSEYCRSLDEYMQFIRNILNDTANPPTDRELDDFALNIPVLIYFTGEAQEALGIKEDVAKAVKQELYNEIYDKARVAGKSLWIKVYSGTVDDWISNCERLVKRYGSECLYFYFNPMPMADARMLLDYADKNWCNVKGDFKV